MFKRVLMGDFETTVYEDQESTEVWASAIVELWTENVLIFHSLPETFDYLCKLKGNTTLYYHNLKFDGSFWLDFLIHKKGFTQALDGDEFLENKYMPNNSFKYLISDTGQWYSMTIKTRGRYIEIRDSLKLLPFSVEELGKSFKTKHRKLDMEYKGYRFAGCEITPEEQKYIANDVLVVKEALEIMIGQGHNRLTIGSCCLNEYRSIVGNSLYNDYFPDQTSRKLEPTIYGAESVDEYVRKSYHGGWCYLVKGKESKIYHNGITADVNSLYPSMMSSASGNYYPVGNPEFWEGDFPEIWNGQEMESLRSYAKNKDNYIYYFVRFRCRFKIKAGYLPTVQIKGNSFYSPTEWLTNSDVYDKNTKQFYRYYKDVHGQVVEAKPTLTMTMIDYELFREHYQVFDEEILDGCYYSAEPAEYLFDRYIEKYKKIKMESTGAIRTIAKQFLNSLYGQMARSMISDYKVARLNEDESDFDYYPVEANKKKPGYIPIGSAITSYARNFTIRTAQKNYYGVDRPGFIYADTDSIHCDLSPDQLKGVPVHPTEFCCWKLESSWDEAIFVRQKTYIEHVTKEDLKPIEDPYYSVKCAGMPEKAKKLFICSMTGTEPDFKITERQKQFIEEKRELQNFDIGLMVPDGKLIPIRIPGGVVLREIDFEMRLNLWHI